MNELLKIEIPQYITHVRLSKSRRAKYYTVNMRRKLPKKYKNANYGYNSKGVLINLLTKEPVIANPKTVGTPREKKINGQEIYSGNVPPTIRSIIVREMKQFYKQFIPSTHKIREKCKIKLEIFNAIGVGNQDLDNMSWIILKVVQDVLVEKQVLPEDNILVVDNLEIQFHPIDSEENRKLVITVSLSELNNELIYED